MDLVTELTIFVLSGFVGFAVISKVPTTLHTPLMSQTNAITRTPHPASAGNSPNTINAPNTTMP